MRRVLEELQDYSMISIKDIARGRILRHTLNGRKMLILERLEPELYLGIYRFIYVEQNGRIRPSSISDSGRKWYDRIA